MAASSAARPGCCRASSPTYGRCGRRSASSWTRRSSNAGGTANRPTARTIRTSSRGFGRNSDKGAPPCTESRRATALDCRMAAEPTVVDDGPAREVARRMAEAAGAWLDALDPQQRRVASGAVPGNDASDAERRRWFYTPTDHGGLTFHEQRPAQQRAAMRLVASGLSTAAYVTVATIIGLENILDEVEGFVTRFDRERGRDPGLYYLRVFGQPGGSEPWGWRFGGHHVSLNNLVVGGAVVATTPLLPRRGPGHVAVARRCGESTPGSGGRSRARPGSLATAGAGCPRGAAAQGAVGSRHGQPHDGLPGEPGHPADGDLARRAVPRPG